VRVVEQAQAQPQVVARGADRLGSGRDLGDGQVGQDGRVGRLPAGARALGCEALEAVAPQHPGAVEPAHDGARGGKLLEGERDGGAPGADHATERFVREREAHDDPVATDPAPALGEVPEEREEAQIDPGQLRDGALERQRGRLASRAREQARHDRRPRLQRGQQVRVEHGDPAGSARRPAQLGRDERGVGVPEARDIARPEEVGGDAPGHQDVAHDRALGQEEARGAVVSDQLRR